MRSSLVVLAFVAALAAGVMIGSRFAAEPAVEIETRADGDGDDANLLARLDAIETELAKLAREVRSARAQPRVAAASGGDPVVNEAELAEAVARIQAERRDDRLAALSDAELLAEAQRLVRTDPAEARRLLELALARPLEQEPLTRAMTQLGLLARTGGDVDEAERILHNAATAGAGTDTGTWASYELAMTVSDRGDHERALAIAEPVPTTPGISEWNRLHSLWTIATIEERSGDLAAAKAAYRSIVDSCESPDEFAWMIDKARARIGER